MLSAASELRQSANLDRNRRSDLLTLLRKWLHDRAQHE